jgi:CelD/BcsL family acetyltransferase involved in cellulose biosynthesis
VTSSENCEEIRREWQELFAAAPDACVFQSAEWSFTWLKHLHEAVELAVVIVRDGKNLVGLGPFVASQRLGKSQVEPFGHDQYGYSGLLLRDRREDVVVAMAAKLAAQYPDAIFHLPYFAAGDFAIDNLAAYLQATGWKEARWPRNVCHFVPGEGGYEGLLARMPRKSKYNMKRERQKLEDNYLVEVRCYRGQAVNGDMVDQVASIQQRSWLARRGQEALNSSFFGEVIPALARAGHAEIWILYLNSVPVAFVLNYISKKVIHCAYIGFDEKFAAFSPGKCLMADCLERVLASGTVDYDFMFGDGEYKRFWSNRTKYVFRAVYYRGVLGCLLSWMPHRLHGRLSRYKWLKKWVNRTRSNTIIRRITTFSH